MDVALIPFAKHIGIEKKEEGILKLQPADELQNHIQSIHAAAQFALAETQSGLYLQKEFPELVGKVAAVLRGATVKYKSQASTTIVAEATLLKVDREKFLLQLERKGRATIGIDVILYDEENVVTMQGEFTWFVQKLS